MENDTGPNEPTLGNGGTDAGGNDEPRYVYAGPYKVRDTRTGEILGVRSQVVQRWKRGEIDPAEGSGTEEGAQEERNPRSVAPPRVEAARKRSVNRKTLAAEYGIALGAAFGTYAALTARPYWVLNEDEQKSLGEALADVTPSLPAETAKAISNAGPWIKLVCVGGTIVFRRVGTDKAMEMRAKMQQQQQSAAPRPQPAPPPRPGSPDVVVPTGGNSQTNVIPFTPAPSPAAIDIPGFTSR